MSLGWRPGDQAISFDIYFGENYDNVKNGTGGMFQGNQSKLFFIAGFPGYPYPEGLVPGTNYYWRIDEVDTDGKIIKGDIWSLRTSNPLPKGRACFLPEIPVMTNGRLVQIRNVTASRTIESVQEHEGTFVCRDIALETENTISVVEAHCFMTDSGQWVAAQNMTTGLRLKTLTGTVGIKSITTRNYTGKVYNLKIRNSDRYMVGKDSVIVRDF